MNSRRTTAIRRVADGPSDQPLVAVFIAAAAGMALDRWLADSGLTVTAPLWWWAAIACWLGWWILARAGRDRSAAVVLLGSLFCLAAMWHHGRWNLFAGDDLGLFAQRERTPIRLQAVVVRAPRRLLPPPEDPLRLHRPETRSVVEIRALAIGDGRQWRPVSGWSSLICQGELTGIHAGDRLRICGRLGRPPASQNPGEFDLARHCRSDRRLSTIWSDQPESVQVVASGSRYSLGRLLDGIRLWGLNYISERLDPSRQGLAAAMLLGARQELTSQQTEAFFLTGTIHLLVVSGLHLGMLAGGLVLLLRLALTPAGATTVAVTAVAIGYALLTDAEPPVVRAAVLVVITCAGRLLSRDALGLNSLAAAALVVLAISPADLFRSGPQLSFLAVAALIWFSSWRYDRSEPPDPLTELVRQTRPAVWRWARVGGVWAADLTWAGLVVWIVVQPLVMSRFHLFTPAAILLGPILWLPVAAILVTGFAALAAGAVVPLCGAPLLWVCEWSLAVTDWLVRAGESSPWAYFWVCGPAEWWLAGWYLMAAVPLVAPQVKPPRRLVLGACAGWIAIGFGWGLVSGSPPGALRCTFLAVGHGSATVIECPDGPRILYDAGSSGPPQRTARSIAGCLWSLGITRIDAIVLSHADLDHYNAVPELAKRFRIARVIVAEGMLSSLSSGVCVLEQSLLAAGVAIDSVAAGDRLRVGSDTVMEIHHPPAGEAFGQLQVSDNSQSVVLSVEYAGRRILLPGDLEPPGLFSLLGQPPVDCDILLAPHHGSRHSFPAGFARWATPEWVVISGAADMATERSTEGAYGGGGAVVLPTHRSGAVRFAVRAEGIDCETFGGRFPGFVGWMPVDQRLERSMPAAGIRR